VAELQFHYKFASPVAWNGGRQSSNQSGRVVRIRGRGVIGGRRAVDLTALLLRGSSGDYPRARPADVFDETHSLWEFYSALCNVRTGAPRKCVQWLFEHYGWAETINEIDVLLIDTVVVHSRYRGRGYGLVALHDVLAAFATHECIYALQPGQFHTNGFAAQGAAAINKLCAYWECAGLRRIGASRWFAWNTALIRPSAALMLDRYNARARRAECGTRRAA